MVDLPRPGIYHLEVRDGHNNARSTVPYTLRATLTPTKDTGELNNTRETATRYPWGRPSRPIFSRRPMRIGMPSPLRHKAPSKWPLPTCRPNWTSPFKSMGRRKGSCKDGLPRPKLARRMCGWWISPRPGIYHLEVRDGHNNARSTVPYTLRATLTPTKDTGELNNTRETATPLPLGQAIQANILPKADADWYAITVEAQGALEVAITDMPPELDIAFQVYGPEKGLLQGWLTTPKIGQENVRVVDLPRPGIYHLEVRDGHNNARSTVPYTLRATLTPTKDTGELNNTRETATPLPLGQAIQANILPKADADWYAITVEAQGALEVAITDMPPELDIALSSLWAGERAPARMAHHAQNWPGECAGGGSPAPRHLSSGSTRWPQQRAVESAIYINYSPNTSIGTRNWNGSPWA